MGNPHCPSPFRNRCRSLSISNYSFSIAVLCDIRHNQCLQRASVHGIIIGPLQYSAKSHHLSCCPVSHQNGALPCLILLSNTDSFSR